MVVGMIQQLLAPCAAGECLCLLRVDLFKKPESIMINSSVYSFLICYNNLLYMTKSTATDKNKIVDNYCLEELRFTSPDQSQLWTAKHIILKKNFTLKRVKYSGTTVPKTQQPTNVQEWNYQNITRQVSLLKRLKTEHSPTYHKMIKSNTFIYLIYDEFPALTLKDFLVKNNPNKQGKLWLMNSIAKTLKGIHAVGIMMLLLSCENIYLKDSKDIFLGDWSLVCLDSSSKIEHKFISNQSGGLAPEILTEGTCSFSSDIYSLGKIFEKIYRIRSLESTETTEGRLLEIISQMTYSQPAKRPQLADVIKAIEDCGRAKSNSYSFPSSQSHTVLPLKQAQKNGHFLKGKRAQTMVEDNKEKYSQMMDDRHTPKAVQTSRKPVSSTQLSEAMTVGNNPEGNRVFRKVGSRISLNTSLGTIDKSEVKDSRREHETARGIKIANKSRNLAFFLSNLAEFVIKIWVCPELAYLLIKYAKLTLQAILEERSRESAQSEAAKQFTVIVKKQIQILSSNLNSLGQSFRYLQKEKRFASELTETSSINDRYLNQKILQFGGEMLDACDQYLTVKNSSSSLGDSLFQTYMILKKIEEGRYETFWDRIYNPENAFLSNQKYFNEEKSIGPMQLKSRIADILKGK